MISLAAASILADFDSGFDHSYGGGLCLFYDGVNFV